MRPPKGRAGGSAASDKDRRPSGGGGRRRSPGSVASPTPNAPPANEPLAQLRDDEAGALQIGVTDQAMVRLIVSTRAGVFDLDFEPDEAGDIAAELIAAAERAKAQR